MAYIPRPGATGDEQCKVFTAMQHAQVIKSTQALMGICAGICADNLLHDREIQFLAAWLREHEEVASAWPGREIARRVRDILADGIVTDAERADLLDTAKKLSGTYFSDTGAAAEEGPALPIDDDPSIYFRDMSFCFTGRFVYGTRACCERAVLKAGGMPVDTVGKRLNYLVIGTLIEPHWINTTYGRKIEKAVTYRDAGCDLTIVSERQWTAALADLGGSAR